MRNLTIKSFQSFERDINNTELFNPIEDYILFTKILNDIETKLNSNNNIFSTIKNLVVNNSEHFNFNIIRNSIFKDASKEIRQALEFRIIPSEQNTIDADILKKDLIKLLETYLYFYRETLIKDIESVEDIIGCTFDGKTRYILNYLPDDIDTDENNLSKLMLIDGTRSQLRYVFETLVEIISYNCSKFLFDENDYDVMYTPYFDKFYEINYNNESLNSAQRIYITRNDNYISIFIPSSEMYAKGTFESLMINNNINLTVQNSFDIEEARKYIEG